MCGLVGIVSVEPLPPDTPLVAMRDTLAHRGPDAAGDWTSPDRRVWLGHRRLAVVDVSAAANQPMTSASGRHVVAFNGELYNHRALGETLRGKGARWRTSSDTEVLVEALEAWGVDALPRLHGMFALAVVDVAHGRVLLARDRAGEKPLYLARVGGALLFASELRALLAYPGVPRVIDPEALACYLAYGYAPGDRCLLRGVRKLRPGHALSVDLASGAEREWAWWTPPRPGEADTAAPSEATHATSSRLRAAVDADALERRFETLLEEAVARQLSADVPVGVLLSGGLDSSLVAALAARHTPRRLRTFTVTFPGHAGHDEGPHARLVAEALGTEHTELRAEGALIETLSVLAQHLDEPIADSAIVPTAELSRLVRQHVTVALGGDGSDELFGGYPHYQWMQRFAALRRVTPAGARGALAWAAARQPVGTSRRHHLMGLAGPFGSSVAHVNLYFDRATRAALVPRLAAEEAANAVPEAWRAHLGADVIDPRDRAMRADWASTLPDGYLARVDRASMRVALEVRAPFLDAAVIDFALREVPADLKVTATERKVLPRRLAARLLPPGFDRTRKQGFTMPLAAWFDQGWHGFVTDTLDAETELFDGAAVARLIHGQRAGHANIERIFALTMLALWRREWGVAVG